MQQPLSPFSRKQTQKHFCSHVEVVGTVSKWNNESELYLLPVVDCCLEVVVIATVSGFVCLPPSLSPRSQSTSCHQYSHSWPVVYLLLLHTTAQSLALYLPWKRELYNVQFVKLPVTILRYQLPLVEEQVINQSTFNDNKKKKMNSSKSIAISKMWMWEGKTFNLSRSWQGGIFPLLLLDFA